MNCRRTNILFILSILVWFRASYADETAPVKVVEHAITADDRDHWSFRGLSRPSVPDVKQTGWPRNAIDRFILAKIEQAGLTPMPETDRLTLLRRVTFDLTGLPPTPNEIDSFIEDRSPDDYQKLVDRLLASPAYGERWAQHWLDVARFAETDGFEHDKVRPEAWQYRDWVIAALNADMGYNEFVQLQLAGDELRRGDKAAAIATKFLLCGPDMPDINLQEERRHNFLNDMTATVSSVFLGLQMGCAQCHDHKYDPISQHDFYRLRAVFEPALRLQQRKSISRLDERSEPGQSFLMIRGDFRRRGPPVEPAFPRIANPGDERVPAKSADAVTSGRRTALARWLTRPDHPLTLRVIVNRIWQHHFGHGLSRTPSDFGVMGDSPTHPELLDWLATELPRLGWSMKRMHRLMVTSATYRQASRPSNVAWTARNKSEALAAWKRARQADPENRLHARMSRRRLEGEAIRDTMLAVSDNLSQRRGGPGVRPPLPKELLITLLKNQWPVTKNAEDHRRRSIYLFVRRNLRYPIFEAFDKPDTNTSCPQRSRSTIAPQALMLLNSKLSLSAAREFSGSLIRHAGIDRRQQIELCYRCALCRRPTATERELAIQFLSKNAARLRAEHRPVSELAISKPLPSNVDPYHAAALTDLCVAIFNINEFVYID